MVPGTIWGCHHLSPYKTRHTGGMNRFMNGLLEYPQYTRPEEFMGRKVPEILLSGHHAKIDAWRHEQALERTRERRPDLLNE